jgi:hypothetical protein
MKQLFVLDVFQNLFDRLIVSAYGCKLVAKKQQQQNG